MIIFVTILGHAVDVIMAIRRYFECSKCFQRENTLGPDKIPRGSCIRCGEYSWRPCGKNGTGHRMAIYILLIVIVICG